MAISGIRFMTYICVILVHFCLKTYMKKLLFSFVGIISFSLSFSQVEIDYVNYTKRLIINNQVIPLQEAYMIGVSYDQLLAIKRTSTNFNRELLNYYQYIEDIKSPYELMDEYNYIKTEIEIWGEDLKNKNTAQINAEVDAIWYGGERLLNELGVNTRAKTETGAILLAIAKEGTKEIQKENIKKRRDKEIEDAKRRAKKQLEQALDKKLKPIRDNIILDNNNFFQSYTKTAAYALTQVEQDYYLQLARYHESISKYVNQNYSINDLNWLSPNINKPLVKYFEPNSQDVDFAFVALMKYNFYKETKIDIFNESFQKYLDAAINQNPNNTEIFVLKSKAETDVIEKYKYAKHAYELAIETTNNSQYYNTDSLINQRALYKPNIRNVETQYQKTKKVFEDYIFNGIKYNKPYINKCIQKGYHIGLQNENYETPIIVAIRYDQAKLLETIINKYINPIEEIDARGHFYLLYAVTNKSESCIDKLLQYGVDLNYTDRNGLSALSIALLQENSTVVEMLLKKGANKDVALKYIAYNDNSNILDKCCSALYDYDQKNTQTILKYNPNFFKNNYGGLSINTSVNDAKIFVNNEFIGSGNVNIGKIQKSNAINIRIQKTGMKEEVFTVPIVKNKITYVDVNMVKWIPLITLIDANNWHDYYTDPILLNELKTKKKQGIVIGLIYTVGFGSLTYLAIANDRYGLAVPPGIFAGLGFFGLVHSIATPEKKWYDKGWTKPDKEAILYNQLSKQEAEQKAKQLIENQNSSILNQNMTIIETNSSWISKRSVKYKVGIGDYNYIIKPTASGDVIETNQYTNSKPVSNNTVSFPFVVSKSKYSSHYNLEEKAVLDCGSNYRIADWNDLKTYKQDIEKLAEYLNMSSDEYKSLFITKDGERLYYNDRQYFIALQNHNKPSSWMTHDNIDNHFISLGSWINKNYHILCIKKQ